MSGEAASTPVPKNSKLRWVPVVIGIALVALALGYWFYSARHPATQDAYLRANYVWISPRVFGQVSEVHVRPDQYVRAGDPILQLDPSIYEAAVSQAHANLIETEHYNKGAAAEVESAKQEVKQQQAILADAEDKKNRLIPLVKKGVIDELEGVQIESSFLEARAAFARSESMLAKEVAQLGSAEVQAARVEAAEAELRKAQLDLEHTTLRAPADGWVTQFSPRVGDVVEPGDQLFPFIEDGDWWVHANFKETEIEGIKPGKPARVTIDMYGSREFEGVVESLSFGSAASFALLPPQNTTGNWVKVTQRIPVRVRLRKVDPEYPPRYGASATVTVDIDSESEKVMPEGVPLEDDRVVPRTSPTSSPAPAATPAPES